MGSSSSRGKKRDKWTTEEGQSEKEKRRANNTTCDTAPAFHLLLPYLVVGKTEPCVQRDVLNDALRPRV
jgi:hypothetical protein